MRVESCSTVVRLTFVRINRALCAEKGGGALSGGTPGGQGAESS